MNGKEAKDQIYRHFGCEYGYEISSKIGVDLYCTKVYPTIRWLSGMWDARGIDPQKVPDVDVAVILTAEEVAEFQARLAEIKKEFPDVAACPASLQIASA